MVNTGFDTSFDQWFEKEWPEIERWMAKDFTTLNFPKPILKTMFQCVTMKAYAAGGKRVLSEWQDCHAYKKFLEDNK